MNRSMAALSGALIAAAVGLLVAAGWFLVGPSGEEPARAGTVPGPGAAPATASVPAGATSATGGAVPEPDTSRGSVGPESTTPPQAVPSVAADARMADPVTVRVPALDIEARTVPLDLDHQGALTPPPHGLAGWWFDGPEPGEVGAAVIVGHVDSRRGPDVFLRLGEAAVGDVIEVERADGTRGTWVVTGGEQAAKDEFPTEAVYTRTDTPTLRLVTCGGEIDPATGHYVDNVIVYADLHVGED